MRVNILFVLLLAMCGFLCSVGAFTQAPAENPAPAAVSTPATQTAPPVSETPASKSEEVNGQGTKPAPVVSAHPATKMNCTDCHKVENPTKDSAALKPCPRPKDMEAAAAKDLPDFLILDQLSNLYVPVVFPHKLHLKMEAMGSGCAICHHHSEPGKTPACRECHKPGGDSADLKQPSLKGAYHRQCLACHREWSHENDCMVCHAKRGATPPAEIKPDTSDMLGKLHPNVVEPEKFVYNTPNVGENIKVTFRHKEHIEVFGKRCVDCHRQENCSRCHDPAKNEKHVRKDVHEDCSGCHDVQNGDCTQCHQDKETPPFDHATRTNGFSLAEYHAALACNKCHTDPKSYKGLTRACDTCHKPDFQPKEFKHERTGFKLDALHEAASCKDCHTQSIGKPAVCTGCHKDGRKYPDKMPGEKVAKPAATVPTPETVPPATSPAPESPKS